MSFRKFHRFYIYLTNLYLFRHISKIETEKNGKKNEIIERLEVAPIRLTRKTSSA